MFVMFIYGFWYKESIFTLCAKFRTACLNMSGIVQSLDIGKQTIRIAEESYCLTYNGINLCITCIQFIRQRTIAQKVNKGKVS